MKVASALGGRLDFQDSRSGQPGSAAVWRWKIAILCLAAIAIAAVQALGSHAGHVRRADSLERAQAAAQREARVLGMLWRQTLGQIGVLQDTAGALSRALARGDAGAASTIREQLDTILAVEPKGDISQVGAIGADGMLMWSTQKQDQSGPLDLSQREHFRVFADPTLQEFISQPVLGKLSHQWTVQFARAVRGEQGQLIAVTVVSYRSDAPRRFLASLALGDAPIYAIWRNDGTPLGLSPAQEIRDGLRSRFAGRCPSGSLLLDQGLSHTDGQNRIFAGECLDGTGTFVSVGLSEAVWMAGAEATVAMIHRGTTALTVLVLLAAALGVRIVHQSAVSRDARLREKALQADQNLFRDLLGNVGDTLLKSIGPDLRIEYVSPGVRNLLGIAPDELTGKSFKVLVHPGDQAVVNARFSHLTAGQGGGRAEYRFIRPDGTLIWVEAESVAVPGPDGMAIYSALRDVTERHGARVALEEAKADIDAILALSPGVLSRYHVDAAGNRRLLYVSPSVERISGFTPAEAMGAQGFDTIVPGGLFERAGAALAASLEPGRATVDFASRHKDGTARMRRAYIQRLEHPDGQREEVWYVVDITQLHAAEQARHEAEQRLAELVERSPAILFQYVVEADGTERQIYSSPNMVRLSGYPAAFLEQPDAWRRYAGEEAAQRWPGVRARIIASGAGQWEYKIICADGREVQVLSSCRAEPHGDGAWLLTGSLIDVTAQRDAEQQLEHARRDLEAAIDAGPGALLRVRLDPSARPLVLSASRAVERMTGYTLAEVTAPGWLDTAIDPASADAAAQCVHKCLTFQPCAVELRMLTRPGDWRWMEWSLRPQERLADGGAIVVAYMLDVTQKKDQDTRMLHSAKLATLGELTTSLAHELNQPLAIMSMAAENAKLDLANPARAGSVMARLDRIHTQALRASKLIDHLRVFGRSQEGGTSPVLVDDVLSGALLLASAKLRNCGLTVEPPGASGLPAVQGNLLLLEQVMLNLISNACDAYEMAFPPVPPDRRLLKIDAFVRDGRIVITVADKAGGIPATVIDHVFEPFFTTKTASKGTGVGLSFCYGVITDMSGTLQAYNADGGAVFEIVLPMAGAALTESAALALPQ